MRVIHLCFLLHEPFGLREFAGELPYFENKESFDKANREIYQPFFALLERNTQKNRNFRVSLVVSGIWIELAEHYDMELIRRLKKLVNLGQVELVAEPYYHSLAFFYDENELSFQVKQYQSKVQSTFGAKTQIFCMPEFLYNDALAKWAEDFGFAGMLAGSSDSALSWHSTNHVYEAVGCEYLRVLFRNAVLSNAIMQSDPKIMSEQVVDKEKQTKKMMLSVVDFRKMLDLEFLRGGLVNLYLDASCIGALREVGVVGFFDELFEDWLDGSNNKFATASMACVVETPSSELAIPEAVSWLDVKKEAKKSGGDSLEVATKMGLKLPDGLNSEDQIGFAKELYGLRREILASEDEKLIEDYRHLLAADYQLELTKKKLENYEKILQDLKTRAETIKKQQVVEISKVYTKRHDRGEVRSKTVAMEETGKPSVKKDSDSVVAVHFGGGARHAGPRSSDIHGKVKLDDEHEGIVEVHRLPSVGRPDIRQSSVAVSQYGEVEVDGREGDDVDEMMNWAGAKEGETIEDNKKGLKHSIRRVIKKLVIE